MTREEAIEYLNTLYMALAVFPNQQISLGNVDEMKESVSMAIKALEQEPCDKCVYSTKDGYCQYDDIAETISPLEPCDDAVSRQNIIDTYESCADMLSDEELEGANLVMEWIYKAPSVTQKPIECDDVVSRQAVLNTVERMYKACDGDLKDYHDLLVSCVEELMSVRPQEPNSDIRLNRVKNELNQVKNELNQVKNELEPKEEHTDVFEVVNAPWIFLDNCANSGYYCSKCKKKLVKDGWSETVKKINFCPNCGARMVEPKESEEICNIKNAEWLEYHNQTRFYAKCSNCKTLHDEKSNYCPFCGTRMNGNYKGLTKIVIGENDVI